MRVCVSCDQFVDVGSSRCPKCSTRLLSLDEFRMPDLASPKEGRSLLDARIGTVLGGEWVVDGILGEGGDGVVYRVHSRKSGVSAAAKRQRSAVEQRIDGPNVLTQVGSAAGADGRRFSLFEHCPAGSLRGLLDRMQASGMRPAQSQVVETLRQITRGLLVFHGRGLVHGDVKPDNVLVATGDSGAVQLKLGDPLAPEDLGKSRGSPPYAAPEVCDGAPVTAQADLWALGVIAHEMITGSLPFDATGREGVVQQVVSDKVAPPPLPRTTKIRLAKLVRSLLAKDPGLRPASPREVLTTLDLVDADPEEWQRLGSLGLAVVGVVVLGLALAFGGGSAPRKLRQPEPGGLRAEPSSAQQSQQQKTPVQPPPPEVVKVEPTVSKTVEPEPKRSPRAKVRLDRSGHRVASDSGGVLRFHVEEGKELKLDFKLEGGDADAAVRVRFKELGGDKWSPDGGGSLVLSSAQLPKPGDAPKTFDYQCCVDGKAEDWSDISPEQFSVACFASHPKASANGEVIELSGASGFTHWGLVGGEPKAIDQPISCRGEEWTVAKRVVFYLKSGEAILETREANVAWVGRSVALIDKLDLEQAVLEVECADNCEFRLVGVGEGAPFDVPLVPSPGTEVSRRSFDLRSALCSGFEQGFNRFRLDATKGQKPVVLRRDGSDWSDELKVDPMKLFEADRLFRFHDAKYEVDLNLVGAASVGPGIRLRCKVEVLVPGAAKLGLKVGKDEKGAWEWDAKAKELVHQVGTTVPERISCRLGLGTGELENYSMALKLPYGPEPFRQLAKLGAACVPGKDILKRHDFSKASLFSSLIPVLFGYQDDPFAKFRPDWVGGGDIRVPAGRHVALLPTGPDDLVKIRAWLKRLDASFSQLSLPEAACGELRDLSDREIDAWFRVSGDRAKGTFAEAVDVIEGYVAVLCWAAKQAGCSVAVEPSNLADYLVLSDCGKVMALGGTANQELLEHRFGAGPAGLLFPLAWQDRELPDGLPLEKFIEDSTWKRFDVRSSKGVKLVWQDGAWGLPTDATDKVPLHFLVTFVK